MEHYAVLLSVAKLYHEVFLFLQFLHIIPLSTKKCYSLISTDVPDSNGKSFAMGFPPHDDVDSADLYDMTQLVLILAGSATEAEVNVTVPAGTVPDQQVRELEYRKYDFNNF